MPRLLPLISLAYAAGILAADARFVDGPSALLIGGPALGLALLAGRRPRLRATFAVAVFGAAGSLALARPLAEAERSAPQTATSVIVQATVCGAGGLTHLRVDLCDVTAIGADAPPVPARVSLSSRAADGGEQGWLEGLRPGDLIRAHVRLRPVDGLANPGGRAQRADRSRRGIGARARLVDAALRVRVAEDGGSEGGGAEDWPTRALRAGEHPLLALDRRLAELRARIGERLARRGQGGELLRALAVGDRRGLGRVTRDAFRQLGIGHLLAVSGLHLALVSGLAYLAMRHALARVTPLAARRDVRPLALACAFAAAVAYALLSGFGVPVRRALLFLAALATGLALGRRMGALHALSGAALVVLIFEPWALFEPGPQLSFAASAALLASTRRDSPRARSRLESLRMRAFEAVRSLVRASASAVAATAPLVAIHGGVVGPAGLVANLVAVPWTAWALLPAALAAAASSLLAPEPLATWIPELASVLAEATLLTVERSAAFLPRLAPVATPPVWILGLAALLAVAACRTARVSLALGLALTVALLLRLAPPEAVPPAPPRVVAFDVGHGDATLVQGRRAAILVDGAAAQPDGFDLGRSAVVPALAALGVRALDIVVATHADADHRGGLPAVLRALPVRALWLPPGGRSAPAFDALVEEATARGVAVVERSAGDPTVELGDLRVVTLWPPRTAEGSRNDRSLVLRVEACEDGRSVLLTGDVGGAVERALLTARDAPLRADVLKVAHHGSRYGSQPAFLEAVGADVALVSAACEGRPGLPHPDVLARLRESGAATWWTGRHGAILVGLSREGPLAAWSWRDARPCGLRAGPGLPEP